MTHGQTLNKRLRERGIVWHDCHGCGNPWPFPVGVTPGTQAHEQREWLCHRCVQAERAAEARAMTIPVFIERCKAKGLHFTANWVERRLREGV